MKQYLLSFSFLLISLFSYGQETKVVLDSNFVYIDNNQNEWILSYKKYYEYDQEVQLTRYEHYDKFGYQKERYSYNKQNLIDTIFINTLYISRDSAKYSKFRVKTYTNNLILSDIEYSLSKLDNSWYEGRRYDYEYNDKGWLINEITDSSYRLHYEYNEDSLLTRLQDQFKTSNGNWGNFITITYQYDNNKNLIRRTDSNNDGAVETLYFYDALNRRIKDSTTTMDIWGAFPQSKTIYEYDNQNRLTARYYYNSLGYCFDRNLFSYHSNGQLEEYNWQNRDSLTGPWQNRTKNYDLFNSADQIIESYKDLVWDRQFNDWKYGRKIINQYNDFGLKSEMTQTTRGDNFQNSFPFKDSKEQWFYSEKEVIIPELPPIEENCPFLNPYLPFTTVHCENWELYTEYQLQVYSIDGRFVYNKNFIGCDGFRVEKQLNKGWYVFLVLENGKPIQKQKILVF